MTQYRINCLADRMQRSLIEKMFPHQSRYFGCSRVTLMLPRHCSHVINNTISKRCQKCDNGNDALENHENFEDSENFEDFEDLMTYRSFDDY